jgi:hypothetical protein
MEWDFTTSQVLGGEIDYGLEDFIRDLKGEMEYNFPKYEKRKQKRLFELYYRVFYFSFNCKSVDEISKLMGIEKEFVEIIIEGGKDNIAMLEAIIMGKFIQNLRDSGGMLSDSMNLKLLSAQVRDFHKKHKL